MWKMNIETFIGCTKSYDESDTVLFGAPFDSTTSYRPGTRFGSRAIRSESYGIETYSPYLDLDLEDTSIYDYGDIELALGNTERVLGQISDLVKNVLNDFKTPVMLGGEHLVTLGAVREVHKKYPDLHILQFDAHADLRQDYLENELSHATVIRRCWELVGDGKIIQMGIRSGEKAEFEFAAEHTNLFKFNLDNLDEVIIQLKGKSVYFTLDMDVLDPSIFPGTGTPEAGGISFSALHSAVLKLKDLNIVACDMTELSPPYDQSGVSTAVCCKLLRELLLTINQSNMTTRR